MSLHFSQLTEREAAYTEETGNLKHQYDERLIAFSEYVDAERKAGVEKERDQLLQLAAERLDLYDALKAKIITVTESQKEATKLDADEAKIKREARKAETKLDEEIGRDHLIQEKDLALVKHRKPAGRPPAPKKEGAKKRKTAPGPAKKKGLK